MTITQKPQYKFIADAIRQDILSGMIAPGTKLQPDTELAQKYGVNKRTVSNGMAQLVADGLISRTPGRGSIVVRRKVVTRKNSLIGILNCCNGDIYEKMERVITEQILKKGFYPMWVPQSLYASGICHRAYHPFRQMLERFINDCPYGMIIHGERFIPFNLLERNLSKIGKLVFVSDYLHTKKIPANYVLIDYGKAAEKITSHLLERNHRHFTMLTTPVNNPVTRTSKPPQAILVRELAKAARAKNMNFDMRIPELLFNAKNPEKVLVEKFVNKGITAAVLGYDSAWPCIYGPCFKKLGISIPRNVYLIGFFNTPWADKFNLTSIDVHENRIAKLATELLFEDNEKQKEIYVEPDLVVRDSISCNRL